MNGVESRFNITLDQQIACLKRELAMRARVYGKRVSNGQMRRSEAEFEYAAMRAALRTLEKLQLCGGELAA